MNPPSILIVDDEESVRFILQRTLRREGYVLDTAVNGQEALQKLAHTSYDLLLLDLHMEPVDGMTVFHTARQLDTDLMVIILTAHGSIESAIKALRLGAFDYLLKPADPQQIRQCIQAGLAQRHKNSQQRQLLQQIATLRQTLNQLEVAEPQPPPDVNNRFLVASPLLMDLHHQTATLDGRILDLTTTEFNLLHCLVNHAPEPISPQSLITCAMEYESEDYEAREIVKYHIHNLRRKLEPDLSRPCYIKTVRYKGYLWSGEPPRQPFPTFPNPF